ncbi:hypothetical protein DUI87_06144 [Hirundo rustica rustica]|uniref:RNase H type-1 domain-containing protein n=1 Tax=Hirundo rustica rustica TaxID=333673 RepID=A0A3M0L1J9_HIRRU|nr:hypothetical protein DUI87_06144 [Hirundo rustica rustica]
MGPSVTSGRVSLSLVNSGVFIIVLNHGVEQGYKNSPTIFGEQLAKDLESWEPPPGEGQLLQYVDDLLRATQTQETCVDCTKQGIALGILAQNLGPYQRAVAYLSKQLDTAAKGWPSGSTGEPVIHECLETIEATYSSRQDLKDTPLEDAETCLLMEAAMSSVEEGMLVRSYHKQGGNRVWTINIYTDSRYAFGVVHAHGAIWKERALLNSQGKRIKHAQEILRLLDAVQLPERVAIMHMKAHQKVSSELEEGNVLVDREAKEAAKGEVPDKAVEAALIADGKVSIEGKRQVIPVTIRSYKRGVVMVRLLISECKTQHRGDFSIKTKCTFY